MKTLKIILNGGLQSCCSVVPTETVKEIMGSWVEGVCDLEVTDAKEDEWKVDELASLALKYFGERAYPFIYIDGTLSVIGSIPSRDEITALLSLNDITGIRKEDIVEAAKNYGLAANEGMGV